MQRRKNPIFRSGYPSHCIILVNCYNRGERNTLTLKQFHSYAASNSSLRPRMTAIHSAHSNGSLLSAEAHVLCWLTDGRFHHHDRVKLKEEHRGRDTDRLPILLEARQEKLAVLKNEVALIAH